MSLSVKERNVLAKEYCFFIPLAGEDPSLLDTWVMQEIQSNSERMEPVPRFRLNDIFDPEKRKEITTQYNEYFVKSTPRAAHSNRTRKMAGTLLLSKLFAISAYQKRIGIGYEEIEARSSVKENQLIFHLILQKAPEYESLLTREQRQTAILDELTQFKGLIETWAQEVENVSPNSLSNTLRGNIAGYLKHFKVTGQSLTTEEPAAFKRILEDSQYLQEIAFPSLFGKEPNPFDPSRNYKPNGACCLNHELQEPGAPEKPKLAELIRQGLRTQNPIHAQEVLERSLCRTCPHIEATLQKMGNQKNPDQCLMK